jgi:hypothetical protein
MTNDGKIVCDFCGAAMPSDPSAWYWTHRDASPTRGVIVDYCADCADALPKLIADMRDRGVLRGGT